MSFYHCMLDFYGIRCKVICFFDFLLFMDSYNIVIIVKSVITVCSVSFFKQSTLIKLFFIIVFLKSFLFLLSIFFHRSCDRRCFEFTEIISLTIPVERFLIVLIKRLVFIIPIKIRFSVFVKFTRTIIICTIFIFVRLIISILPVIIWHKHIFTNKLLCLFGILCNFRYGNFFNKCTFVCCLFCFYLLVIRNSNFFLHLNFRCNLLCYRYCRHFRILVGADNRWQIFFFDFRLFVLHSALDRTH